MARKGELPAFIGWPVGHSREGLIVSSAAIIVMAAFFDLSAIAEIGALMMLFIHVITHIGHLRLLTQTGAAPGLIILAILANGIAVALGAWHLAATDPALLVWIGGFLLACFLIEFALYGLTGRTVTTRTSKR